MSNKKVKYKNADFRKPVKKSATDTKSTGKKKTTKSSSEVENTKSKASTKKTTSNDEEVQFVSERDEKPSFESRMQYIQFYTVLFAAISVFLVVLVFIAGSSGWNALHKFIRGLFGLTVFVLPLGFARLAYVLNISLKKPDSGYRNLSVKVEVFKIFGLTFILSGLAQILFGNIRLDHGFTKVFTELYTAGIQFKSAGSMSAIIAYPMLKLLGSTGAKIMILFAAFIFCAWCLNLGIEQILHPVDSFRKWNEKRKNEEAPAVGSEEWNKFSDTDKLPKVPDIPNNFQSIEVEVPTEKVTNKRKQSDDFMMDVPIPNENVFVPEKSNKSNDVDYNIASKGEKVLYNLVDVEEIEKDH